MPQSSGKMKHRRQLTWKLLPGQQLQTKSVRRHASLRLEVLEDRTLTSTVPMGPPPLFGPSSLSQTAAPTTNTAATATNPFASNADLDRILLAIQQIGPASTSSAFDVIFVGYGNPSSVFQTITVSGATTYVPTTSLGSGAEYSIHIGLAQQKIEQFTSTAEALFSLRIAQQIAPTLPSIGPPQGVLQTLSLSPTAALSGAISAPTLDAGPGLRLAAPVPSTAALQGAQGPASAGVVVRIDGSTRPGDGNPNVLVVSTLASTALRTAESASNRFEQRTRWQVSTATVDLRPVQAARPAGPPARVEAGQVLETRLPGPELPDSSLLHRFAVHQDQAAFTALVRRHERFVLSICKRVLGDSHAAEDAFQAIFLVLARRAGSLDSRHPLNAWLYKVAYHLALRVRAVAARQRTSERSSPARAWPGAEGESDCELEKQELRDALHQELQRLPEKYRQPLMLCYLAGHTHEGAARALGMPLGSMAKRIGQGLAILRDRLAERGFTL